MQKEKFTFNVPAIVVTSATEKETPKEVEITNTIIDSTSLTK